MMDGMGVVRSPTVSVIVPACNAAGQIRGCLAALRAQSYLHELTEVVVVDDFSEDGTAAVVVSHGATLLQQPSRAGPYAARNRGLEHARGEVVAFTDADCWPAPDWLERAILAMTGSGADLVGGRVMFRFSRRPRVGELTDALWHLDVERQIADNRACMTANLLVRRAVFEAVGSFDARVRSGGDGRWTRRATDAGFQLTYAADAVVTKEARRLGPLLAKAYRIGRGLPAAWTERGAGRSRIGRGLLRQMLPVSPAALRMQIARRGTLEMDGRLGALWASTWLMEAVRGVGVLRGWLELAAASGRVGNRMRQGSM
jgi:GT2 family glycosyltransferase